MRRDEMGQPEQAVKSPEPKGETSVFERAPVKGVVPADVVQTAPYDKDRHNLLVTLAYMPEDGFRLVVRALEGMAQAHANDGLVFPETRAAFQDIANHAGAHMARKVL
jgi:hypothetical protein